MFVSLYSFITGRDETAGQWRKRDAGSLTVRGTFETVNAGGGQSIPSTDRLVSPPRHRIVARQPLAPGSLRDSLDQILAGVRGGNRRGR